MRVRQEGCCVSAAQAFAVDHVGGKASEHFPSCVAQLFQRHARGQVVYFSKPGRVGVGEEAEVAGCHHAVEQDQPDHRAWVHLRIEARDAAAYTVGYEDELYATATSAVTAIITATTAIAIIASSTARSISGHEGLVHQPLQIHRRVPHVVRVPRLRARHRLERIAGLRLALPVAVVGEHCYLALPLAMVATVDE